MKRNPFRARQIAPGRLPYLFPQDYESAATPTVGSLIDRFVDHGLRGQIVGPHGSGKSTLLQNLVAELQNRDFQVLPVAIVPNTSSRLNPLRLLRKKIRRLQLHPPNSDCSQRLFAIDGGEMASWWIRRSFFRAARRASWGVLLTSHRDLGLPTLWQTTVTVESARRVIDALLDLNSSEQQDVVGEPKGNRIVADALIEDLLVKHNGDLREVLFALYDRWRMEEGDIRSEHGG